MKKLIVSIAVIICLFECSSAISEEIMDEAWIEKQAFQKASEYTRSISCDPDIKQKYLVALVPWKDVKNMYERDKARYALIWHGDIGCMGGSGSYYPYITIIRISSGDSFVVDPLASSPMIKFETQVYSIDSIVKVTSNELTLTALDWAPGDYPNFPSVLARIVLRQDKDGNWKFVKKEPAK